MATKEQAKALFCRFYPESHTTLKSAGKEEKELSPAEKTLAIQTLAEKFAEGVPEHEFSTAEMQGYLLSCKKEPEQAVDGILDWVVQERKDREDKEVREAERKAKRDANQSLTRMGIVSPPPTTTTTGTVDQQPLLPVLEPMTPSTPNTLGTPPFELNMDMAAIAEEARRQVVQNLEGLNFVSIDGDEGLIPKPIVNGTTESGFITPPGT